MWVYLARVNDEKRGQPSYWVRYAEISSIRVGSLFLTLPTRALTGQHVICSAGMARAWS